MLHKTSKGMSSMRAAAAALALGSVHASVSAQQSDAIVRHADDAAIAWGACPDFMPAGCELTVLRGDPAKPNADVLLRVPAGAMLPRHWHTSAERMVLIAGELRVQYDGGAAMTLKTGSYAYGPARRPHAGVCMSTVPCVLFIAFEAAVDAVPGTAQ